MANSESGFNTTFALPVSASDTTITLTSVPTATSGRLYAYYGNISNPAQEEWIDYTGISGSTITGCTRNMSQTADPSTGGTGYSWIAGTPVILVLMHDQIPMKTKSNTFGTGTTQTFDNAQFIKGGYSTTYATTAARDAALGGDGACLYPYTGVLAAGVYYNYNTSTSQRESVDTGTATPFASTTAAGIVEAPTQTQVEHLATTGETGALVFVTPTTINPSSITGATIASGDKISFSDVSDTNYLKSQTWSGALDALYVQRNVYGTGADGAQSGALTVTGSNNTYILKQYTTMTPGANTVTITPTNCILHIKVQGDCDLTGTTFTFNAKGGTAGAAGSGGGGATVNGGTGGNGNATMVVVNGGAGGGGTATQAPLLAINHNAGFLQAGCGGGGGGGQYDADFGGSAGAGGAGGGCLILEVGGNLTFSSTTMNFQGANGSNGTTGQAGGGGGGGGSILILYRGTLTGSPTTNVAGGSASTGAGLVGAQGGNGIINTGSAGSGSNGGAGGAGSYYIAQVV